MASIFTRIIDGELPGTFVHRDETCVVILSINPLAPGHCLVIPIEEVDHWIDLRPELAAHLFAVAHRVGRALDEVYSPARVGLIIAGYEVAHTHLHVLATDTMAQFDFRNAGSAGQAELAVEAARIRAALAAG